MEDVECSMLNNNSDKYIKLDHKHAFMARRVAAHDDTISAFNFSCFAELENTVLGNYTLTENELNAVLERSDAIFYSLNTDDRARFGWR